MTIEHSKNAPSAASNDDERDKTKGRWSELARAKAEIVRPLVGLHPIPPDHLAEARRKAASLLGKPQVSRTVIYDWLRKMAAGGISALEHQAHRDRGESTLHPDLRQYIEDLLLSARKYTLAAAHRLGRDKAREMELDESDWPTYDQVRFIDGKLSEAAKKYGREGRRAYRQTHELVGRFEASTINEIWQCDHHLLDILVIVNPDTGETARPWLTAVIDDYSRAIMGFHLSLENGNSNSIALTLHHALLPKSTEIWPMHGIPCLLYVDNGKDFRSKHIQEACLHFQIEHRSHEPYLARSKGKIERWFHTLEGMRIAYLDGYVGGNAQKRPHRVTPRLTLDQLRESITDYIVNTYHERVHSQTKEAPRVRWQRQLTALRTIEKEDDLDYLLESTSRTVQNDGIQFNNSFYTDREGKLGSYINRKVHIFYNRNDKSCIRVRVRDEGGEHFLCTAYPGIDAMARAEQNKAVRQQLAREARVSHARSKAEEQRKEREEAAGAHQMVQPQKQEDLPKQVAPDHKQPFIRYRFQIEETDNDA